jgi:S-adenosylmethionine:tRNA ribosyltransferase-isomerase
VWYPSPRLVELRFDTEGAALWSALYRLGRPIQYAHLEAGLALSDVQTAYASRPWAAELPSAGRPLNWELLLSLKRQGIALAAVTHAAGLSSTGDPALDHALPLPERYEIPPETVEAVGKARARSGRVVAVGTSVVRALEGCALRHGPRLAAGRGLTDLVVGPGFVPQVVDGLLTGFHEPGSSHLGLLRAFVAPPLLDQAYAHAEAAGYRGHEFGDSNLILAA